MGQGLKWGCCSLNGARCRLSERKDEVGGDGGSVGCRSVAQGALVNGIMMPVAMRPETLPTVYYKIPFFV